MATVKPKSTARKKTLKSTGPSEVVAKPNLEEGNAPIQELPIPLESFERHIDRLANEMRRAINEVNVAAQVLALGPDRIAEMPAQDHMFRFHLPQVNRDVVQRKMLLNGVFPNVDGYNALSLRLPRGGVFIDVGGYLGVSSSFFAKVCQADVLHVFEPQNVVREILRKNLELNEVENVTIYDQAVMDGCTNVDPGAFKPHDMGATPFLKHANGRYQGVSLDSMDVDRVDVIHMDFSGPKMLALEGANDLIKRCKPFLIIDKASRDLREVVDHILPLGYRHDQSAGLMMFYPEAT